MPETPSNPVLPPPAPPAPLAPLPPSDEFLTAASEAGIVFTPGDLEKLGLYLAILLDANKAFNLTAITDPAEAWIKHIYDSLTLMPFLAEVAAAKEEVFALAKAAGKTNVSDPAGGRALRIIDIGSGGGVPGIPLAIALPDVRVVLVEPTGKKAAFLLETAERLKLKNVRVLQDRAERLGQAREHREQYDVATARAVGALNILAELTIPMVRMHGLVLAIKGAKADEEVVTAKEALRQLGGVHDQTLQTPTGRIVVIRKGMKTPNGFPRSDGTPKNKPIGGKHVAPAPPDQAVAAPGSAAPVSDDAQDA